jgi:hypothetical protein
MEAKDSNYVDTRGGFTNINSGVSTKGNTLIQSAPNKNLNPRNQRRPNHQ